MRRTSVRRAHVRWVVLAAAAALFVVVVVNTGWWQAVFQAIFASQTEVLYPRATPLMLVWEHVQLVGISSAVTVAVGIPLGVWVTRSSGREFLQLVTDITSVGQTFPPVAVLALAVPALGFGLVPTVVALFLYGLLPVVRNTIAGLRSVPVDALDAARGMGMGRWQALWRVELPMAAPIILAGVRISVIINIGTAMIGAVIGAGGLGTTVVAGLVRNNLAFVVEGALAAALLAILVDQLLHTVETSLDRARNEG